MRLGKNVAKTRTEGECSLAEMFISHINKKNMRLKHANSSVLSDLKHRKFGRTRNS